MPVSAAGASLDTPLPIAAGALAANTWLALVGYTVPLPASRPSILLDYMRGLDQTTFAPHYLKLTYLGASFLNLRSIADQERTAKSTVMSWAELEYTTLLNVVQMPSEYLDVRDEMPATPGAVVTHMLQSLVFLRIYDHLLCQEPALGQSLGLRPVPGVVHFLCVIARSVLTCPPQIVKHWPILDEVQASSAQTLLNIWQLTEAENCRALLNLWKPTPGRFDDLSREVRAKIGSGPWDVEVIDGYSVFWVFRDLRSLSLEMHMRDRDQDL